MDILPVSPLPEAGDLRGPHRCIGDSDSGDDKDQGENGSTQKPHMYTQ